MGKITIRHTKGTFRKSKLTKTSSGQYHCPTCGAFRSTGSSKKKK